MFTLSNPFNKPEKTPSEKGLLEVLDYTKKSKRDIAQLANNQRISANNLKTFGSTLGADMSDITNNMSKLLNEWSNIIIEFADVFDQYRDTLQSIVDKESALTNSREQKRKIRDSIDRQGSFTSLDKVTQLKQQLAQLEEFTEPDEVEMTNFKRVATREALYILLNGMHAMSSKTDIISTFGKYVADELKIEVDQTQSEYTGADKTKAVYKDAVKAIEKWIPDKRKLRRTLTSHHGHNPLVLKKKLPPTPISTEEDPLTAIDTDETPIPDRIASMFPVNQQFPPYKPDDVDRNNNGSNWPEPENKPSHMYLHSSHVIQHQQPKLDHRNLYQFYQNYLPPKPYNEISGIFSPGAVFGGNHGLKEGSTVDNGKTTAVHDAGGFVLPDSNPNFLPPLPPRVVSPSVSSNNFPKPVVINPSATTSTSIEK